MSLSSLAAPRAAAGRSSRSARNREPAPPLWRWPVWVAVAAAVIAGAVVIVLETQMSPSFDAYGWLTWAHQLLYGNLNLNAAPSWKPLMIVFTLPMVLFGRTAPKLLSIAMTTGTLAMAPFAGRIAYRLILGDADSEQRTRRLMIAAWAGALLAAAGVLGLQGHDVPTTIGPPQSLWRLTFIADSDPLGAAIVLAAVDAHVSRRPWLAYGLLFAAGLIRPEAWFLLGLYGLYLMWTVPGSRLIVVGSWVLVLVAWYLPTAVAAKSIFRGSQLDLGKTVAITGEPVIPVLKRWATFYEWPMQAAALLGVAIAVLRRDRRTLLVVAAIVVWLLVEMAFALHGFSAVARYVIEPAALMVVLAGYGFGRALAGPSRRPSRRVARWTVSLVGPVVVVGLLVGVANFWHIRESRVRVQLPGVRNYSIIAHHLSEAVDRAGGPKSILACGPAAARNQYQTQLAWWMNLNGSQVEFNLPLLFHVHRRMVLFQQTGLNGWTVRAYNMPPALAARCDRSVSVTIPST